MSDTFEEVNDAKRIHLVPLRPARQYSINQWVMLAENERATVELEACMEWGTKLTSTQQVLDKILDFIHVTNLNGQPCKLASINRRFQALLKRMHMKSMDSFHYLLRENAVSTKRVNNGLCIVTTSYKDDKDNQLKAHLNTENLMASISAWQEFWANPH